MPKLSPKDIAWNPVPGYVLCRIVKREEMQKNIGGLELPDNVGKVSDSVGVGEVLLKGRPVNDDLRLGLLKLQAEGLISKDEMEKEFLLNTADVELGDFIAFMPFTDQLIEIDLVKYSLIGYDKIRAVRKATK